MPPGPEFPITPRGAGQRLRSSVRYFGSLIVIPTVREHQSSADSAENLSTAGSLILNRTIGSTFSVEEKVSRLDEGNCLISKIYRVPEHILKRGFIRLETRYSPDSPGELRSSLILATLRFFDVHFHVHRSELERASIVEMLDASPTDFTKKKWNDKSLLQAFHVRMNIAERIYFTVDVGGTSNLFSRFVSGVMVFAIVVSIAVWMAGTVPSCTVVPCETCEPEPLEWMRVVDEVCVIIFTVEFLTRMLTAPFARAKLLQQRFLLNLLFDCKGRYQEAQELPQRQPSGHIRFTWISNWWSFWKQPSSVVDLFTILPYWVEVWFATSADGNFIWLRLFRLLRVSRIFKLVQLLNSDLGQLSDAQHLLANVFMQASPAFAITLALLLFALIVFSSLMYVVERASWYPASVVLQLEQRNFRTVNFQAVVHEAERAGGVFLRSLPDGYLELSPFTSIVSSCWWTLATITTVGYGDHVPVTIGGKMVGAVAILYGTVLLGLPIGIIGSQFSTEFARMVSANRTRQERNHRRNEDAEEEDDCRLPRLPPPRKDHAAVDKRKSISQHVVHTLKKVLNRKKGDKAGSKDVALALEQLPLKPKQREQLIGSKYAFEDVLKLHGENLGISVETQQHWMEALWKCHFKAGPELDRLSARVLTFLSDVELRRGSGNAQSLRLAWFDLCLACCSVSEKLAIANRFDKVLEDSSNSDSTPDDPEPDVLEERESIDPLPRISL